MDRLRQAHDNNAKRAVPKTVPKVAKAVSMAMANASKPNEFIAPPRPKAPPWDNRDLPPRFLAYALSAFSADAQRRVVEFLEGKIWSLYLHGDTGSRKTSLAVAALVEERRRRDSAHCYGEFVPAYEAVERLRDVKNANTLATKRRWQHSPFLVLDDLGKHRDTPHVIEQLLFLVHARYDWGRTTIVTANMGLDRLAKRIDDATARRLKEGRVLKMEKAT